MQIPICATCIRSYIPGFPLKKLIMRCHFLIVAMAAFFTSCVLAATEARQSKFSGINAVDDHSSINAAGVDVNSQRFLRSYGINKLERVIKFDNRKKIDDFFKTKKREKVLDPAKVDDLLANKKLGG
ncbi:uncharacterized protein KRP23_3498 [Phytophthora ramorum]|uniref:uncharacterized protein n=1 Tax=Phytophthora ramorum TaxID=164328 RepID=UPI00309D4914|nr:hypothetical protein KRP23_3498 [Phytophthora ramorum]KAH7508175.1 hypothetical protein KRP22_3265 [Phytophthora ramorum]